MKLRWLSLWTNVKILAINLWKGLSKFRDAGREDCFCSEQDHPEFPVQEEGQSRGTESPERGPFSTRNIQIAFMMDLSESET